MRGQRLWLAVGLWERQEVRVMPLSTLQPEAGLAGSLRALPRSLAWLPLGTRLYLVAGTADGETVIFGYEVGPSGWLTLAGCGRLLVGLGLVQLHVRGLLGDPEGQDIGVLAVAEQALLIRPASGYGLGGAPPLAFPPSPSPSFARVMRRVQLSHRQAYYECACGRACMQAVLYARTHMWVAIDVRSDVYTLESDNSALIVVGRGTKTLAIERDGEDGSGIRRLLGTVHT